MDETGASFRRRQRVILIAVAIGVGAVTGGTFAFSASRGDDVDPWFGLPLGAVVGLGMVLVGAVVMRRTQPAMDAMQGLSRDERKAVGRAVSHGVPVDDPRLAHAAVLLAEQQLSPFPGPEWAKNGLPFLIMGGFLALTGAVSGRWSSAAIGIALVGVGVLARATRGRVRHALEANQRLLDA